MLNLCDYRRYVTADAMGMAKERGKHEGEECRWCRNRVGDKHGEDTTMYPGSGLSWRDKPLLLLISYIAHYLYKVLLELYLLSYSNLLSCSNPATALILARRGEESSRSPWMRSGGK